MCHGCPQVCKFDFKATHLGTLETGQRQEQGQPWSRFCRQLCLMLSLRLEWHSLHLVFTPLPWQGCAHGPAGSLATEPGAETSFLLPT